MIDRIKKILYRLRYRRAVAAESIEERFSNIYKYNIWFTNKESKSGAGSTIEATRNLRTNLPMVLQELNTKTLIDVGCGDFNWMKEVHLSCRYIGVDIVKHVIDENKRLFENETRSFLHLNAVNEPVPNENDSAILCREVLFHLSLTDGLKMVDNFVRSKSKYLMLTTDMTTVENKDIKTGSFRNLNLQLPPFNFPPPIKALADNSVSKNRVLGVWSIADLKNRRGEETV